MATTTPRAAPTESSSGKMLAQGWLLKKGGSKAHADAEATSPTGDGPVSEIRQMFDHYDEDGNGELSPVEIKKLARELGKDLSKSELEQIISELSDSDGGA